jgi:hypothetical protein
MTPRPVLQWQRSTAGVGSLGPAPVTALTISLRARVTRCGLPDGVVVHADG